MEAQEVVHCRGHSLILGTHSTTFEVTRDDSLTPKGNCIVGVAADKGCDGLSPEFKAVLCNDDATLLTVLACGGYTAEVISRGSSSMNLDHPADLVWRRSSFVCGRTIGILSNHTAATLPPALIANLVSGGEMVVTLVARRPG